MSKQATKANERMMKMRERPTRLIALTQVFCESKTLPKGKIQEHLDTSIWIFIQVKFWSTFVFTCKKT